MSHRFKDRPLSHSQISSWEWSPEQWYNSYVLGIKEPASPEMLIGNLIGDTIGRENCPLGLQNSGITEYKLIGAIDDIKLIGYVDIYNPETKVLHENKTSYNVNRWSQSKANKHQQLTMYALLLEQQDGVAPESVTMYLNFIPLRIVGVNYQLHDPIIWKQYPTKRTSEQVSEYKEYILRTVEAMERYIDNRPLSTTPKRRPAYKGV